MTNKDIRWRQRFENFEKSLELLQVALNLKSNDVIYRAGMVQFFEMTFELAWKTMRDYLLEEGFKDLNTPREIIKKSFETGLITDGHNWLNALDDRNLTSHTYNEIAAKKIELLIREKYFLLLTDLHKIFKAKS